MYQADLQSAYHQLTKLRDCSAKLQLYGLVRSSWPFSMFLVLSHN